MRSRQAGVTFIGWVVLLIPVAIVGFAGIKLSTLYMNNFKVSKAIEQTAKSTEDAGPGTPVAVRSEIDRRFNIEGIEVPTGDDITVEKEGEGWAIGVDYTRETELFGNLSLRVHFTKRVVIK
jgi:hypothetical protein